MKKKNGVNHSMQLAVISRRRSVITRLENQLKVGTKTNKDGDVVLLSKSDVSRINKELETLKSRI